MLSIDYMRIITWLKSKEKLLMMFTASKELGSIKRKKRNQSYLMIFSVVMEGRK